MKRKILAFLVMASLSLASFGGDPTNTATLTWDWCTNDVPDVYSAKIYVGYTNVYRKYTTNFVVNSVGYPTNNTFSINIPMNYSIYAVTAVNSFGDESDFSNELVIRRVKPTSPVISNYTIKLQK